MEAILQAFSSPEWVLENLVAPTIVFVLTGLIGYIGVKLSRLGRRWIDIIICVYAGAAVVVASINAYTATDPQLLGYASTLVMRTVDRVLYLAVYGGVPAVIIGCWVYGADEFAELFRPLPVKFVFAMAYLASLLIVAGATLRHPDKLNEMLAGYSVLSLIVLPVVLVIAMGCYHAICAATGRS
jgi:hypothetical protein